MKREASFHFDCIPGFAEGGGGSDHGERALCTDHGDWREREHLNAGLGSERGSGIRGQSPLKLKAFCTFLYKKVAKS